MGHDRRTFLARLGAWVGGFSLWGTASIAGGSSLPRKGDQKQRLLRATEGEPRVIVGDSEVVEGPFVRIIYNDNPLPMTMAHNLAWSISQDRHRAQWLTFTGRLWERTERIPELQIGIRHDGGGVVTVVMYDVAVEQQHGARIYFGPERGVAPLVPKSVKRPGTLVTTYVVASG